MIDITSWAFPVVYLTVGFIASVIGVRLDRINELKQGKKDYEDGDILLVAFMLTVGWPVAIIIFSLKKAGPFFRHLYTPAVVRKNSKTKEVDHA